MNQLLRRLLLPGSMLTFIAATAIAEPSVDARLDRFDPARTGLITSAEDLREKLHFTVDEKTPTREFDHWQFMGSFGIAYESIAAAPVERFRASAGIPIPFSLSFGAFHPRSHPGGVHFGYTIDLVADLIDAALESSQFSQAVIGGGVLAYLDFQKKTYLRGSFGLSGAGFTHTDKPIGGEQTDSTISYTNGVGGVVEIGRVFSANPSGNVEAEIFTYSLQVMTANARNRELGTLSAVSVALRLGVLF